MWFYSKSRKVDSDVYVKEVFYDVVGDDKTNVKSFEVKRLGVCLETSRRFLKTSSSFFKTS